MKREKVCTGMPARSRVGLSSASWNDGKRADSVGMLISATGFKLALRKKPSTDHTEDSVESVDDHCAQYFFFGESGAISGFGLEVFSGAISGIGRGAFSGAISGIGRALSGAISGMGRGAFSGAISG